MMLIYIFQKQIHIFFVMCYFIFSGLLQIRE